MSLCTLCYSFQGLTFSLAIILIVHIDTPKLPLHFIHLQYSIPLSFEVSI